MAKLIGNWFFLFVSFFTFAILPAHCVYMYIGNINGVGWGDEGITYEMIKSCEKNVLLLEDDTKAVVCHVVASEKYTEIMKPCYYSERRNIQNYLAEAKYEMVFLESDDFKEITISLIFAYVRAMVGYRTKLVKDYNIYLIVDRSLNMGIPDNFDEEAEVYVKNVKRLLNEIPLPLDGEESLDGEELDGEEETP